ncbi:type II pantothenate kinase [Bacillus sp. ISL-47]|uniref:type II pantothenate kinase n=1 Tax=Bacillus sp. ISL-47 TaxID=2819130 RepID=UPI001BE887FE|nr:type II pantothenate kinase [Bacillus sp. ISL-47]MBT2689886.1 type II pantothenate kinase [Bacillus sp. ISL-47]MBT2710264.1 type II pantothenate kinase [Pseudomonas sp. ISL-84]
MKTVKIGIDAGGTLLKMIYEESGRFHYKTYSMDDLQSSMSWLKVTAAGAYVALTGGQSEFLKKNYFPNAITVSEFQANCEGAAFLMKQEGITKENYLLINIGTGTSIYLCKAREYTRILGSGIGGGTFLGLGKLITGITDFSDLVSLARNGEAAAADLLVKDIYHPSKPPIDGCLTASNFGKIRKSEDVSNEDKIASLTNMIAETIVLLSMQAASQHRINDIVYIGNTLKNNMQLNSRIGFYTNMLGLNPVFVQNGEYSGAVGAFLSL